ncbi:3-oxoacid CoA-transferase subunit B [Halalkalibacter krulwichiae]|uniref:Putative succinyl-CoA:3-ketoacid coenzyme A transferase subunit B n=1 Tax=Halalkalibacter krulwichiae TaxID=199441 RepID=A0A1X9MFK8_9BACI|nr:3-oxoacid CoA-transferase subunit B [Halalkalibacter krulwichiae]ARK31310.1 putative succinyl-CoA:3-ketoacid coenzyme A transferase subunit B [Halalkalibacter krulwichiae]
MRSTKKEIQELIAKRAADELHPESIINLGIGIPTLVAKYVDTSSVFFHTENGMLGVGELPSDEEFDPSLVNAGKLPIAETVGASYFSSSDSFAMIRGGHVDVAVLGALEVDEQGFIANWAVPGKNIMGVGGAMDLLSGVKKVIVTTNHTTKTGEPKIVNQCSYPITSVRKVDVIITELAVFTFNDGQLQLAELMPNVTLEEVKEKTDAHFELSPNMLLKS